VIDVLCFLGDLLLDFALPSGRVEAELQDGRFSCLNAIAFRGVLDEALLLSDVGV